MLAPFGALALLLFVTAPASAGCPKLLMFDGTNFHTQATDEQAAYWGDTVGVQGFFVNRVMASWQDDVGTRTDSKLWRQLGLFQSIYARHGVADNFIKVALYKPIDWRDGDALKQVVRNFSHAAALARHAGLKGIAIDLEPYEPTWVDSGELSATVQAEASAIAEAMRTAYPQMTLVVIKDALHQNYPHTPLDELVSKFGTDPGPSRHFWHGGYALAIPFLRGLLSADWAHVVVATEVTYDGADMAAELLTGQGFGAQEVDLVWEAIARSPGVRRRPWVSIHAGGGSQRTSADIDVSGRTETETETTAADRTSPLGRRALTELLVADGMRLRRACASGAPG